MFPTQSKVMHITSPAKSSATSGLILTRHWLKSCRGADMARWREPLAQTASAPSMMSLREPHGMIHKTLCLSLMSQELPVSGHAAGCPSASRLNCSAVAATRSVAKSKRDITPRRTALEVTGHVRQMDSTWNFMACKSPGTKLLGASNSV